MLSEKEIVMHIRMKVKMAIAAVYVPRHQYVVFLKVKRRRRQYLNLLASIHPVLSLLLQVVDESAFLGLVSLSDYRAELTIFPLFTTSLTPDSLFLT